HQGGGLAGLDLHRPFGAAHRGDRLRSENLKFAAPLGMKFDQQRAAVELHRCRQPVLGRGGRMIDRARRRRDRKRGAAAQNLIIGISLSGLRTQAPDCAKAGPKVPAQSASRIPAPQKMGDMGRYCRDAMAKLPHLEWGERSGSGESDDTALWPNSLLL